MKRREFVKTMTAAGTGLLLQAGSGTALRAWDAQPDFSVRRLMVMFKCHFDAGFIDTQANVVRKYFTEYFPRALEIARAANAEGKKRYVWTTGSWLLYEYLEQASAADRKTMEEAIARGDIAWHAALHVAVGDDEPVDDRRRRVAVTCARPALRHGDDRRKDD